MEKAEKPDKIADDNHDDEAYSIIAPSEEAPIIPYNVKSGDPLPIPDGLPEEGNQFTFRAVAVGCLLGSVVQASNMYLGLKTGFTFGASLFGALFGYAFLKPLSKSKLPIFGGYFGPKENCTVQTAATASGGLGILFSTGVPAMYQLGLLSPNPKDDIAKLILFAMAGAFFGMAFAIPLRTHYILRQKLLFPTPTATAIAIQRLHSGPEGEETGKKQVRCLGLAFSGAMSLRVLSQYLPGIVWKWHWGWWLYLMGAKQAVGIDNWTWAILRNHPSFPWCGDPHRTQCITVVYLGSLLAWGIIGPILVAKNIAYGSQRLPDTYPEIYDYQSLSSAFTTATHPSARYWLLWPGVLLLIVSSFTELGLNGKKMVMGIWTIARTAVDTVFRPNKNKDSASPGEN
ncbi:hypothetical protein H4Q26_006990 [Puccinia striiformis f. sp. tritici PST-130]|nr:hypothetical protein H4Q26_006990 [Puccinia striiformis f. sp. tritici PST-130]